ncbi:LysM peptidoglycan-binding domain-containing protein [Streptomyces sp. AC495_CC817]|uniref:LysM peptidoglycan-binding domain-containing protein n=1 Tax=Streptomyces sp. AC495_CC817 TaxID=2823900 RepID=UPI001C25D318|nr:LysM peptidoglycan-binding domain-containing protein [Streptomyces sp. AC495_CC817]
MRQTTIARRTRLLQFGAPAAVLGSLAAALVPVPAHAAEPTATGRLHLSSARILPTASAPADYTVQPGDTVYDIAQHFGLRTADVLSRNGLTSQSVIHPGQTLVLTGPASTPSAAPVAAALAATTHTVAAGDTVFAIAKKYGVTVDAVLSANGLTRASVIYPGQTLAVAATAAVAAAAPVVASPAPVPSSGAHTHVVAAGDTLFAIAEKYGTTTAALYALNGLSSSSIIYPGQSIAVSAPPAAAPVATVRSAELDAEQAANAVRIISIGRQLGVPDRGIAIALATAMVESSMRNLDWGDRDSLGLFQQRPSTGWGTPDQVLDADRSTRVFFGGHGDPNGDATRGLLDIPGWEGMAFTDAAQAVQISAYPDRYGQWEAQAYQWLAVHG